MVCKCCARRSFRRIICINLRKVGLKALKGQQPCSLDVTWCGFTAFHQSFISLSNQHGATNFKFPMVSTCIAGLCDQVTESDSLVGKASTAALPGTKPQSCLPKPRPSCHRLSRVTSQGVLWTAGKIWKGEWDGRNENPLQKQHFKLGIAWGSLELGSKRTCTINNYSINN